ncbi:MAG: DUF6079 family protein [Pyrinomonadaceae bacterium]
MSNINNKIKDIVEVRPFRSIRDFIADPAETLANYCFTDATADLMAKWLDAVAQIRPGTGAAFALAGYRGVGKSHFLATLGALASSPELRGKVSESHVEFSAQRLQRRHYPVCYLRRGTHSALIEEFRAAVAVTFDIGNADKLSSFEEILSAASQKAGDSGWLLLIDTALERGSRVDRDDGEDLTRIADAARSSNVFVGVALDDDIADADGSNASIVSSFSIDFLDQSHLFKVVNAHVFPKNVQKQAVLHDIYAYFRAVLPGFRWSEQKFSSLYPLHPAILEVAPYVRLYVPDFALLGFAAEAGEKILGRPANSLIALDEVYDNSEAGLRKIDDLEEAFAAYDKLNSTVVNKIPVMHRLQAKLILKALLLLSLDGQGATASEICASELIFDENDPASGPSTVEELLQTFAQALPEDFRVAAEEGVETRYSFKVRSKEGLNNALEEAVRKISADVIPALFSRVFIDRFPDAAAPGENRENPATFDASLVWRGATRPGRIIWPGSAASVPTNPNDPSWWADWEVRVGFDPEEAEPAPRVDGTVRAIWKPDRLRPDEVERLLSLHALLNQTDLRERFSEEIRASIHAHSLAAEKIFNRCFLEDGQLVVDGFDFNFTEEARSAPDLAELFSIMLEPLFETRYPSHPHFTRVFDGGDVVTIVTDLYNSSRRELADVQVKAQTFAFPLGLVGLEGTSFVPEPRERLAALPAVEAVTNLFTADPAATVALSDVFQLLRQPPFGLTRPAQQMLLTALVAERFVEFVTTSGNRINQRSLDLKLIWEDISGLARPIETAASGEDLKQWAKIFVKDGEFSRFDRPADREALAKALASWIAEWDQARVLERFLEVPEDKLYVGIWQLAARASKNFGPVVDKIRDAVAGTLPLEQCLGAVADSFTGSPEEFSKGEEGLERLASFVKGYQLRKEIMAYIAGSEATDIQEIEDLRGRIFVLMSLAESHPSEAVNRELGYAWDRFLREYTAYFEERHAAGSNSPERKARFDEVQKSEAAAEFDLLAKLPGFDQKYARLADGYRRRFYSADCGRNVSALLRTQPFCQCGFSLNLSEDVEYLPAALNDCIQAGLAAFRAVLNANSELLIGSIEKLAADSNEPSVESACRGLVSCLRSGRDVPRFDDIQLKVLSQTLDRVESGMKLPSRSRRSASREPASRGSRVEAVEIDEAETESVLLSL